MIVDLYEKSTNLFYLGIDTSPYYGKSRSYQSLDAGAFAGSIAAGISTLASFRNITLLSTGTSFVSGGYVTIAFWAAGYFGEWVDDTFEDTNLARAAQTITFTAIPIALTAISGVPLGTAALVMGPSAILGLKMSLGRRDEKDHGNFDHFIFKVLPTAMVASHCNRLFGNRILSGMKRPLMMRLSDGHAFSFGIYMVGALAVTSVVCNVSKRVLSDKQHRKIFTPLYFASLFISCYGMAVAAGSSTMQASLLTTASVLTLNIVELARSVLNSKD